jgi:hypothetical protein
MLHVQVDPEAFEFIANTTAAIQSRVWWELVMVEWKAPPKAAQAGVIALLRASIPSASSASKCNCYIPPP